MTYHHKCACGAEINISTDIKFKSVHKCFKCNKKFKFREADNANKKRSENIQSSK